MDGHQDEGELAQMVRHLKEYPCADPEGGTGGLDPPWKITKIYGSLAIRVRIPLKACITVQ